MMVAEAVECFNDERKMIARVDYNIDSELGKLISSTDDKGRHGWISKPVASQIYARTHVHTYIVLVLYMYVVNIISWRYYLW